MEDMEVTESPISTRGNVRKQWNSKKIRSMEKTRYEEEKSSKKKYQRLHYAGKTTTNSIFPKWMKPYNNRVDVGKLCVRCVYCLALSFKNEKYRCCDNGKVFFQEPEAPPQLLLDLFDIRTEIGRKYINFLCKINVLFSFGARQCANENIPGRGVPIAKIRGVNTHTSSSVLTREGRTPRFGALYTLDTKEATEIRVNNDMLTDGIDEQVFYKTLITIKSKKLFSWSQIWQRCLKALIILPKIIISCLISSRKSKFFFKYLFGECMTTQRKIEWRDITSYVFPSRNSSRSREEWRRKGYSQRRTSREIQYTGWNYGSLRLQSLFEFWVKSINHNKYFLARRTWTCKTTKRTQHLSQKWIRNRSSHSLLFSFNQHFLLSTHPSLWKLGFLQQHSLTSTRSKGESSSPSRINRRSRSSWYLW